MAQISTQSAQARENARKSNGEFGSYNAGDSEVSLPEESYPGDDWRDKWGEFIYIDTQDMDPGERQNDESDEYNRAADIVKKQEISGTSDIGESLDEAIDTPMGTYVNTYTPHRVTLSKPDGSSVEFPYRMGSAHGSTPPTSAQVIESVCQDANLVESTDGLEGYAREVGVDPVDQEEDPEGWEQVKQDYHHVQENTENLRNFVGRKSFRQLMWGD